MHLIKRSRTEKQPDFIPTVSRWAIPGHRKVPCKRYNAKGQFIGYSKPKPVINPVEQRAVIEAQKKAAKLPLPKEKAFDMMRYRPLPRHVLLARGPWIKEEKGVALPESKWKHVPWYRVIMVGERVTSCAVGDKVITGRGWRPKEVWLGTTKFYLGYQEAVVGKVEDSPCSTATKTA